MIGRDFTSDDLRWINSQVEKILRHDGPDGHTDGSWIITFFIKALVEGRAERYMQVYGEWVRVKEEGGSNGNL